MGLFSKKKLSVQDLSNEFNSGGMPGQGMPDFNLGINQGLGTQNQQNPYGDPMMDPNSGLKLADLNANQDMNLGGQQGGIDSFGNPRSQQRTENFEYKQPQQYSQPDNSKDIQLILAKLDTIRSEVTNINHRLDNIERQQKETPQKKYPW